ncbi:MAG: ABC transporter ATP-binding protein [Ardenticatenia bacterium]|nr:ABC transporter ATP-binding protein [Ardenticatenia bacterium]
MRAESLYLRRGSRVVLAVERLDVFPGETLALIGPNGAGKSTLLHVLAGLISPDRGRLLFRGRPIRARDTLWYRRHLAVVMQAPLLLDTSVERNVALGLLFRRISREERRTRVARWLERLGIAHLRRRRARALSGGEAQRVALARALATEPDLLFLDEPFAALDAPTRHSLIGELFDVLRETGQTTVVVTHDREEAFTLADRVAVLLAGRIRQVGTPEEVFNRPTDEEVAAFVGVENVLDATIVSVAEGLVRLRVGDVLVDVAGTGHWPGCHVRVAVRPEDITLWPGAPELPPSSARNTLRGDVVHLRPVGTNVRVVIDCGTFEMIALVTRRTVRELGLKPGTPVGLTFKATAAHVIGPGLPGQETS